MVELEPDLRHWQFECGYTHLMLASYADNLFSFSGTVFGATSLLEAFENRIREKWGLVFKDDSREVMPAAKCPIVNVCGPHWKVVSTMKALGATLQNDNSTHSAISVLKAKLRAAFWRNSRNAGFRLLNASGKIDMVQRSTEPVLRFIASAVTPSTQAMDDLDHFQRGLFASILPLPRQADETNNDYFNRKRNHVRDHPACTGSRKWSYIWAQQVVNWDAHLSRERARQAAHRLLPTGCFTNWSFAAQLTAPEHQQALNARRTQMSSRGESRLRSRHFMPVQRRWSEAVDHAKRRLPWSQQLSVFLS